MSLTADQVGGLKVSELKKALTERGLPANGVKSSLQKRLIEAINSAATDASASTGMDVEDAAAADEETIDESVRYKGTVNKFFKRRGFGTITPEGKTADDKDAQVFVHWKQIQSSDQWPTLEDGMVVEYYLGTKKNPRKKNQGTFAANVTLEGGNPVSVADTRNYPDKTQRFQGTVKWFDPRKGFGFVSPKEDFCFEEVDFEAKDAKIYVAREDIKMADGVEVSPSLKKGAEIEFTLYSQDEGKKWGAGEVTKPGGDALGTDDFVTRRPYDPNRPRNKKKKGKKRKGNFQGQVINMGGKKFKMAPMASMFGGMFGGVQPQLVQMNGQTFMMMPAMGAVNQQKKKKRKRNKKKKSVKPAGDAEVGFGTL